MAALQVKTARVAVGSVGSVGIGLAATRLFVAAAVLLLVGAVAGPASAGDCAESHACWDPPYPNMPDIPPPVVRTFKYAPIPQSEQGPAIDPAKGFRVQRLGGGVFMVTQGSYQMMLVVHERGVLAVDAPPPIGAKILQAAEEVAPGKKITHLIYSHAHIDHIGYAGEIQKTNPALRIIAHRETERLLERANDPNRPIPTRTFRGIENPITLGFGGQRLRLNYPGPNHLPGNIEIYHAESRTLMLVDVVPMNFRRLNVAQDIPGVFQLVRNLNARYDFTTLIGGHSNRTSTKADVTQVEEFLSDLHAATAEGLATTKFGETLNPADFTNAIGATDNFLDRVVIHCVNKLTPKWASRLAGFDVWIYEHCQAMEQSLRVDGPSL